MDYQTIVIGGGLVGVAIAYGLIRQVAEVALLDEGDVAFRALGCHSGVILAAAHAEVLAPAIAAGSLPDETVAFRAERFDVQNSTAA